MSWRAADNLRWLESLPGVESPMPMDCHTSLNVGGAADYGVESAKPAALVEECRRRGIPFRLLGAGTNLLVADAGIEGLVIRCVDRRHRVEGTRVYAAAGLKMLRLARICADHDLAGLEWAIGVPGTVGGAVYQNAGCWGGQLSDVLTSVEGYCPGHGPALWSGADLGLGYRTSALREGPLAGCLVEGIWLQLRGGDGDASRREMNRLVAERLGSQPIKTKNCGSVFRNPPGDAAGRLIEACGLKGQRQGGAVISEQHANFIVNTGGAAAADVDRLIERARQAVEERFGTLLEPEVERVGRW